MPRFVHRLLTLCMQIDKEGAEPERVKQELAELQLLPEEWGGQTAVVPVRPTVTALPQWRTV